MSEKVLVVEDDDAIRETVADVLAFEGYRVATQQAIHARIELYTAAQLLRLGLRFFRYWEPNWPERAEAILERAEATESGCKS